MWKLPLTAGAITLALFIGLSLFRVDTSFFLTLFVIGPVLLAFTAVLLVLLVYKAIGRRRGFGTTACTLAVVWVVGVSMFFIHSGKYSFEVRDAARWLIWSHEYKQEVLSQQTTAGELKHIEWDGSGFAGVANNTVYLIFDPTDASHTSGNKSKFNGCAIWHVQQLEAHWYAVLFYTDEDWDDCSK